MNIRVRIGRLVLDGFAAGADERRAIQAAVESELARALAGMRLSPSLERSGSHDRLRAPDIPDASGRPRVLGAQIGRAVGWSMSGPSGNEQRGGI